MNRESLKIRSILLVVLLVLVMAIGIGRLYSLQVVHGEEYLRQSESKLTRSVTLSAPRGEILDRNGRTMVSNRTSFMIEFDAVSWRKVESGTRAELIWELIALCNANGQKHIDTLPVSDTVPFTYTYVKDGGTEAEGNLSAYIKKRKYDAEISADDLISNMAERYEVPETYTKEQVRAIVGVRYATSGIMQSAAEVMAYGTAVKYK